MPARATPWISRSFRTASATPNCPLPPSTTRRSGRPPSSLPRLKRRVSTSRIMAKSSGPVFRLHPKAPVGVLVRPAVQKGNHANPPPGVPGCWRYPRIRCAGAVRAARACVAAFPSSRTWFSCARGGFSSKAWAGVFRGDGQQAARISPLGGTHTHPAFPAFGEPGGKALVVAQKSPASGSRPEAARLRRSVDSGNPEAPRGPTGRGIRSGRRPGR